MACAMGTVTDWGMVTLARGLRLLRCARGDKKRRRLCGGDSDGVRDGDVGAGFEIAAHRCAMVAMKSWVLVGYNTASRSVFNFGAPAGQPAGG
jgi:hypothetical protein